MGVDQAVASGGLIRLPHRMRPRPARQINELESSVGLAPLHSPVTPIFTLNVMLNYFAINLHGALRFRSLCSFLVYLFHILICEGKRGACFMDEVVAAQ